MDTFNTEKLKIEKVLSKLDNISEKINNVELTLLKKRDSIEQNIHKLLKMSEDALIKKLNESFFYKRENVHAVIKVLQSQKIDLLNLATCLLHEENNQILLDKLEKKLSEIEITEALSLEPFQTLEVVFNDNFEVSKNIGYVKTTTLSPTNMTFYVVTKTLSSEVHPNELVYIRVVSNKPYDPFVLHSLNCKICSPGSNEFVSLEGNDLKDNTYEYEFIPKIPGKYGLRVLLYGVDITDSPAFFKVSISLGNMYPILQDKRSNTNWTVCNNALISSDESKVKKSRVLPAISPSQFTSVEPFYSLLDNLTTSEHSDCAILENILKNQTNLKAENILCSDFNDTVQKSACFYTTVSSRTDHLSSHPSFSIKTEIKDENCKSEIGRNEKQGAIATTEGVDSSPVTNIKIGNVFNSFSEPFCSDSIFSSTSKFDDLNSNTCDKKIFWTDKEGWHITRSKVVANFLWQSDENAQFHFPIGVASTPEDKIVVCDTGNHRIVILNSDGRLVSFFGREGFEDGNFKRPSAAVVYPDGKIAVKDDNKIQFFRTSGQFLWSCQNSIFSRPYGLAIDGLGRLITVDVGVQSYLYMFDSRGEVLSKKPFQPLMPVFPYNSKCRFLAANENQVVVVDLGLNCVYVTNFNGELIQEFGSRGKRFGQFCDPAGVTMDSKGNMFIADSKNHRVQVFDSKGEFITTVEFDKAIHRPSDIYLTKTGKLLVLNYVDHSLCAYSLRCC